MYYKLYRFDLSWRWSKRNCIPDDQSFWNLTRVVAFLSMKSFRYSHLLRLSSCSKDHLAAAAGVRQSHVIVVVRRFDAGLAKPWASFCASSVGTSTFSNLPIVACRFDVLFADCSKLLPIAKFDPPPRKLYRPKFSLKTRCSRSTLRSPSTNVPMLAKLAAQSTWTTPVDWMSWYLTLLASPVVSIHEA